MITYLATSDTNFEEIRVLRVVLLVNLTNIPLEDVTDHLQILSRLCHQLAGLALGDLDILLENIGIPEAYF